MTTAIKMTATQLKSTRTSMGYDMRSMAKLLGWPYRTYQDREYGRRGISAEAAQQVQRAVEHDRDTMSRIMKRIGDDIDRRYPAGLIDIKDNKK